MPKIVTSLIFVLHDSCNTRWESATCSAWHIHCCTGNQTRMLTYFWVLQPDQPGLLMSVKLCTYYKYRYKYKPEKTFSPCHHWFLHKKMTEKWAENFHTEMTCLYYYLLVKTNFSPAGPIKWTSQIKVVTGHQHGISAAMFLAHHFETSFCGESRSGITKCPKCVVI